MVSPDLCGVCRGISDLPGSGPRRVGRGEGDGGEREGAAGHLLPGGELFDAKRWLLDLVENMEMIVTVMATLPLFTLLASVVYLSLEKHPGILKNVHP